MSHLDDLVALARAERRSFDGEGVARLRSGTLVRAKQRARHRLLVRRAGAAVIAGAFVGLILLRGASAPGASSSDGLGTSIEGRTERDSTPTVATGVGLSGEAFADRGFSARTEAELAAIAIGDGGYARD